jgi:cytochrome c551/c552
MLKLSQCIARESAMSKHTGGSYQGVAAAYAAQVDANPMKICSEMGKHNQTFLLLKSVLGLIGKPTAVR